MPSMPPPDIDTLAAAMGWWLEVRCSCGQLTQFPVKLLAREHGAHARIRAKIVL